ncbi:MAG: hypothetical protein FRX48_01280 [Lasallia pustulata]|uniref:Phosphoglycerate mutase-like protein n=1 Tax=Lasallia pustulata TaxID=136370 RepID=A0A5M8PXS4_9LECA|nr:MAG: hypothetical protein FRX48_01280 [Lasallia pustulata]
MKLFLIRHGETVDNVAQVYAGVKDSALTLHGSLQATRLGQHLAKAGLRFTRIFSSDLQRAYKTAEAIHLAQIELGVASADCTLAVTQVPLLREQDFGFYEGKPILTRSRGTNKTGKDDHREQRQDDPEFKNVESKESMALRMNTLLDENLLPALQTETEAFEEIIAIVAHGIILSLLWRCFLKRFAAQTVSLAPGLAVGGGGITPLEYLGGWSNTGYMELDIRPRDVPMNSHTPTPISNDNSESVDKSLKSEQSGSTVSVMLGQYMVIKTVNAKEHLKGLKRTGGGVGSSKFDSGQKSIESFFKKRKIG